MGESRKLNVLGCVPSLLNVLFELAHESAAFSEFNVLKNIPVDLEDYLIPDERFSARFFEVYDTPFDPEPLDDYALSVVGTKSKKAVFDHFKELYGLGPEQFPNLLHPTAYVSPSAQLHQGLQLEPMSVISSGTKIGFGVNIKRNCSVGHHCDLRDYVTLNPGVTISGGTTIGEGTMIGSGVVVRNDTSIGENCMIGMGSVVVKDIPPNSVAFGNPCKVVRKNVG